MSYAPFARFAPDESTSQIYMHSVLVDFKIIKDFFMSKGLSEFECMETTTGKKEIIATLNAHKSEFLQLLKESSVNTTHKTLSEDEVESIASAICQFVNYYESRDMPLPSLGGGIIRKRRHSRRKSQRSRKSYRKKSQRKKKTRRRRN
jgi:hypothetical protein